MVTLPFGLMTQARVPCPPIGYAMVLPVLLSFMVMASCATVSVTSDYDQSARFDDLKTYAWMTVNEEPENTRVNNTLVMSRIHDAIDRQLNRKGYQNTPQNPDFFVAYHASVDEKTQIHSIPYYGGGVGVYGFGAVHTNVYQTRYEEGTLIVDIFNSEGKKLLWRGIAKGTVDRQGDPETKTKRINEAVEKILDRFPPQ